MTHLLALDRRVQHSIDQLEQGHPIVLETRLRGEQVQMIYHACEAPNASKEKRFYYVDDPSWLWHDMWPWLLLSSSSAMDASPVRVCTCTFAESV